MVITLGYFGSEDLAILNIMKADDTLRIIFSLQKGQVKLLIHLYLYNILISCYIFAAILTFSYCVCACA